MKTLWLPGFTGLQPLVARALREKKDLTPRHHKQASASPVAAGKEEARRNNIQQQRREGKRREGKPTQQLIISHSKIDMLTPALRTINWRLQETH